MKNRYQPRKNNKFSRSGSTGNFPAYFVLFITLVIIVAGGYLYFKTDAERNDIGDDYCLKRRNSAITVILIDHTDKLNTVQRASLEARLLKIAKSIPKNSLLRVYSVGRATDELLDPVFEGCNPGGEDTVNSLNGNKKFAAKKYEDDFVEPIRNVLIRVVDDRADTESPIMESIQSISVSSFLEEKNINAEKTLILVSDLLQHSSGFSVYKEIPDFKSFNDSQYGKSIKSDLTNVNVQIFRLNRFNARSLQNSRLTEFWEEYFVNQRARVKNLVPIEG